METDTTVDDAGTKDNGDEEVGDDDKDDNGDGDDDDDDDDWDTWE